MNPFSKYVDCINCGNELTTISELSFNTPHDIRCDYCGQEYKGLAKKIKQRKLSIAILFKFLTIMISYAVYTQLGLYPALFTILPFILLYIFALAKGIQWMFRDFQK